jgi:hypothetical protein
MFAVLSGPVPGQQLVETIGGKAIAHALEHVLEVGVRLDVVELRGGEEGAGGSPALAATVRRDLIMPGVWGTRWRSPIRSTRWPAGWFW